MSVLEGFPVFVKDVYKSGNLDYSTSDVDYILGVFTRYSNGLDLDMRCYGEDILSDVSVICTQPVRDSFLYSVVLSYINMCKMGISTYYNS